MQVSYSGKQNDVIRMLVGRYTAKFGDMHPIKREDESQQAYKLRASYGRGIAHAFADAFEVVIASVRISRYGDRLEPIPSPPAFEIGADLLPAIDAGWTAAQNKDGKTRDVAAFYEALEPVLEKYIFPPNLEEQWELARRKAVLDGQEPPEDGDQGWLDEKAAQLEKRAADIRSMLQ